MSMAYPGDKGPDGPKHETHTLTTAELPSFTHSYTPASSGTGEFNDLGKLEAALAQRDKLARALQKFVKYYKRHEPEWDGEFLATDEFLDLRDAFDAAVEALR